MAINPISSGAFAPSSSPAALLSFFCSIVFRQPGSAPVGRCPFLVPVVGLDLRCGAGHLGLKRAAGTFLSALGFESLSCKKDSAPVGRCPFLVPVVGLEPTRSRPRRILNPLRLPFHHTGM